MRSDTYWRIADKKGNLPFLVLGPFGGSNSEKSKMYMCVHLYTGGTYNPGFTVFSRFRQKVGVSGHPSFLPKLFFDLTGFSQKVG